MLTDARLPADFVEFYRRFHSDSLYQIEHINWPLAGKQARQIDSGHVEFWKGFAGSPKPGACSMPVISAQVNLYRNSSRSAT